MERVMSLSPSIVSKRKKILKNWNEQKDTVSEEPAPHLGWKSAENPSFPYEHGRPLETATAQKALDYISAIVRPYPFQLRYAMALPLWERFAREWCDTGDVQKALRAI
jgi:hypothetical protein